MSSVLPSSLDELAHQARADLELLAYPATSWVTPRRTADGRPVQAVLVVGGGQSGLVVAAALRREGVPDVTLLDRQPEGFEGVWETFARMRELRTPKALNGMEFGCPSLSVQRWYQVRHGMEAWHRIERIPRRDWMDYLRWYRATLALPVENEVEVVDVRPEAGVVAVDILHQGRAETRLARTVVLATGYDGAGRWRVPDFVSESLPPERYHHTNGPIDFARLAGKRIGVLGHAASAFDNAGAALAAGAASVDLCFRRARLPRVNPHRHLETAGMMSHFAQLPDAIRWSVARHFRLFDQPPPTLAFETAMAHPRFRLHPGRPWTSLRLEAGEIVIGTPQGELRVDHVLLGTGVVVDLEARGELRTLAPLIQRWRDRYQPPPEEADERLGALPYVAPDFAFLPKDPADAWVQRVFCFNAASSVSHPPHAASISGHRHSARCVVDGVTRRLFLEQTEEVLPDLRAFATVDLPIAEDFEESYRAAALPAA